MPFYGRKSKENACVRVVLLGGQREWARVAHPRGHSHSSARAPSLGPFYGCWCRRERTRGLGVLWSSGVGRSCPGRLLHGRGPKGPSSAVSSGTPRETGRPPPLWCLRLTRETLCGNKKMAPCFADATQLVRCLSVVRVPVIVAILFKFRSFPILFEWIPIFHCLLC